MIPRSWDRALHRAPCSVGSLPLPLPLPCSGSISVSQINKIFKKGGKKYLSSSSSFHLTVAAPVSTPSSPLTKTLQQPVLFLDPLSNPPPQGSGDLPNTEIRPYYSLASNLPNYRCDLLVLAGGAPVNSHLSLNLSSEPRTSQTCLRIRPWGLLFPRLDGSLLSPPTSSSFRPLREDHFSEGHSVQKRHLLLSSACCSLPPRSSTMR